MVESAFARGTKARIGEALCDSDREDEDGSDDEMEEVDTGCNDDDDGNSKEADVDAFEEEDAEEE